MTLISFKEFFDLVVMTLALGYIFSAFMPQQLFGQRGIYHLLKAQAQGLDWEALKYAVIITAPAVALHELGHKFVALLFGLSAEFSASYWGLGLGVFLKMVNAPFIMFVPGYVSIPSDAHVLISGLVALAGPLVNLFLWLGASVYIKFFKLNRKQMILAHLTKKINLFLFIFNILPFGFFDGAKVFKAFAYVFSLF
ncbi:M50 family metallopeptidase, partial [Candidatus Woesearchaeota archaeon]|nr:M50 family metallopeptidase [Candidatus Woesearchaeota archaeon]